MTVRSFREDAAMFGFLVLVALVASIVLPMVGLVWILNRGKLTEQAYYYAAFYAKRRLKKGEKPTYSEIRRGIEKRREYLLQRSNFLVPKAQMKGYDPSWFEPEAFDELLAVCRKHPFFSRTTSSSFRAVMRMGRRARGYAHSNIEDSFFYHLFDKFGEEIKEWGQITQYMFPHDELVPETS